VGFYAALKVGFWPEAEGTGSTIITRFRAGSEGSLNGHKPTLANSHFHAQAMPDIEA